MLRKNRSRLAKFGALLTVLLILAIGTGMAYAMNSGMKRLPIKKFFSQTSTNAVWDWSNITNRSANDLQEVSDFLYMHQINTVYVDVSSYADIIKMPDGEDKTKKTEELDKSLENYVKAMKRRNIKVFAAAGHTDWSMAENQYIPLGIQQHIFDFNNSHADKLAGIEFDIESYNQAHFAEASFTEKGLVLNEFLDTVDKTATAQQNYINSSDQKDFELGFAIPYWYDNENQNIKSVSWKDKTGPVLYHTLDRLNQLPKSNVVVMAYRNAALGNDGMIYHARTEVDYASSRAQNVNILMGIEVNDVEPEKITFYGRSYTELSSEVKQLYAEYNQQDKASSFHGIAINDLQGYEAMKDGAN